MPRSTQMSTTGTIRPADLADLDAVVEIKRSSAVFDTAWNYCYQYCKQFPEDNLKYTTILFRSFLDPSFDDWHVMVAEAPSLEDPNVMKLVAFAVWEISYKNKRKVGC